MIDSTPTLFAPTTTGRLAPAIVPVDPNVRAQDEERLSRQCEIVLGILRSTGMINPPIAERFGITRLAARIHDIRKRRRQLVITGEIEGDDKQATYLLRSESERAS